MANNLTGAFDAVVEVRLAPLNALAASVHQRGAWKGVSPTFPHSFAVRIGDDPGVWAAAVKYAQWTADISAASTNDTAAGLQRIRRVPMGAWHAYELVQAEYRRLGRFHIGPGTIRGTAQVQVSTPRISFVPGATSKASAHVVIRANYIPDPDTDPLPAPIHGEVVATYELEVKTLGDVNVLDVSVTNDNNLIQFLPAAGTSLTNADAAVIASQIRRLLRSAFEPTNHELPDNFLFTTFKALGSGSLQVVALPLMLSGNPQPPGSAVNALSNVFVNPYAHFAVAVSKAYAESQLQPLKDELAAFQTSVELRIGPIDVATYVITISSVALSWHTGSIQLLLHGTAVTQSIFFPNYQFDVSQTLTLSLNVGTQTIIIAAAGDPSITGDLPGPAVQQAREIVMSVRDDALAGAQSAINQALTGNLNLSGALQSFNPSNQASFSSIDVTPDGVILQGTITTGGRLEAVAEFTANATGDAFTALKSWIPAGTIDRFVWSWVTGPKWFPWAQQTHNVAEEHRFVFEKPDDLPADTHVCLLIEGSQVMSGAGLAPVVGGETCKVDSIDLTWVMPSNWVRVMTPIWTPDPPWELPLEEAITGHVDLLAHGRRTSGPGANAIVHFAGDKWSESLPALAEAIQQQAHAKRDAPIALFLVLADKAFGERRSVFERELEPLQRGFSGRLWLTEDYEHGWSRTFGLKRGPATFLMNGNGEFVWHHSGAVDSKLLAVALDRHLVSGGTLRTRPIRLNVKPGDLAPDALITHADGARLALRKLRGRRLILNFWKSWSTPCLKQLERLQRLREETAADRATIYAICDGGSAADVELVRRERDLTLTLVPDQERTVSQRYGIACWPTTVYIRGDGLVEQIEHGAASHRAPPR
jgi:peroxiredoxin